MISTIRVWYLRVTKYELRLMVPQWFCNKIQVIVCTPLDVMWHNKSIWLGRLLSKDLGGDFNPGVLGVADSDQSVIQTSDCSSCQWQRLCNKLEVIVCTLTVVMWPFSHNQLIWSTGCRYRRCNSNLRLFILPVTAAKVAKMKIIPTTKITTSLTGRKMSQIWPVVVVLH